jgi:hypothetical protein
LEGLYIGDAGTYTWLPGDPGVALLLADPDPEPDPLALYLGDDTDAGGWYLGVLEAL